MNKKLQALCAWSGLVGVLVFFVGLLITPFFPLPSPSLSVEEVVAIYQNNTNNIRFGFLVIMSCTIFIFPFVAVISAQLRRIEGPISPVMSYLQLAAGAIGVFIILLPPIPFLVNAFRPEKLPEITYFMNDVAFFCFVLPFPAAVIQNIAIAIGILNDKKEQPLFPRWVAYFNLWVAIGFLPAVTLVFFKEGVFAWNGLFPFWIPAIVFGAWFVVMLVVLLRAINREKYEIES